MPWQLHGDGLQHYGSLHFQEEVIDHLEGLRNTRHNHPERVCDELLRVLETDLAARNVIRRFSKWCHWNGTAEAVAHAQEIATILFGNIPIRLWDEKNNPMPDENSELERYEEWRQQVVAGRPQHRVPLILRGNPDGIAFATLGRAYWLCPCSQPHLHAALVGLASASADLVDEYVHCGECGRRYWVHPGGPHDLDEQSVSCVEQVVM